jgi:hypothetical protein
MENSAETIVLNTAIGKRYRPDGVKYHAGTFTVFNEVFLDECHLDFRFGLYKQMGRCNLC